MANFSKVYGFTNENLSVLPSLYDFNNKKVLTVLGSGDQYFSSLLFGAKEIDTFDINIHAWYYFVLKFMAIRHLSYDEFYELFVTSNLDNIELYNKVRIYLPDEIRDYFDFQIVVKKGLSFIKVSNCLFKSPDKNDGTFIPYFSCEEYTCLQNILNRIDLPKFMATDIIELPKYERYDLMLFSNVYDYTLFDPSTYRAFLENFNCPLFEALYAWQLYDDQAYQFLQQDFTIDKVPSVLTDGSKKNPDMILTYKK